MKKLTFPAAIAIVLFTTGVSAQQDLSQVEITAEAVAGNVTMLQGAGGNIGVSVGDDGILIIDDQFAPLADKIKAALADLSNGDLRYVLNTHFHGDHTGSNAIFGLEALIVAHENVRARLSTEQTVRGNTVPAQPAAAWPVITFDEEMSIHFNGEEISLHFLPAGHTDGDIGIYFHESNVAHLGDHFFKDRFPFVDVGSGGTVQGMAANVATALENLPDDVKIIPGHGALANKADLKLYHEMLEDCLATVQSGIDGGKSLDEIKEAGLSERWDDWGAGFINKDFWIETIHTSLTQ